MITLSLLLNVVVLVPVAGSIAFGAGWTTRAFGPRTAARDILLAVYAAILLGSLGLLALVATIERSSVVEAAVVSLLSVQVVYKVLTAATVRRALTNPVVVSNLGIAVVHAATIANIAPALVG